MNVLKTAIAINRLDLAAYALVLATLKTILPISNTTNTTNTTNSSITNDQIPITGKYEGEPDARKENPAPDLIQEEKVLCAVR